MIINLVVFSVLTFALYYSGEFLDMVFFKRTSSSLYGSYAFLLSMFYFAAIVFFKKEVSCFLIYLGIPLLGVAIAFSTHFLVSDYVMFKSTYCFWMFLLSGLLAIILGEKLIK